MKRWLLVAVLSGCAVPEGVCPAEVVLGTESDTTRAFLALAEGADLTIHRGPQGGWHVWVGVQTTGLARAGALSYVLRSGGQVVSAPLRLDLSSAQLETVDCGWQRPSDALIFSGDGDASRNTGGQLEVTLDSNSVRRSVRLK